MGLVRLGGHNERMGNFVGDFLGEFLGQYPHASCEGDRARDHARHRAIYVGGHFEPVYSV